MPRHRPADRCSALLLALLFAITGLAAVATTGRLAAAAARRDVRRRCSSATPAGASASSRAGSHQLDLHSEVVDQPLRPRDPRRA